MSSAFLYLGIVVMWLCVLVPMWLRRDRPAVEADELYEGEEPDGDTLTDVHVNAPPGKAPELGDDDLTMELDTSAAPGRLASPSTGDDASEAGDRPRTGPFRRLFTNGRSTIPDTPPQAPGDLTEAPLPSTDHAADLRHAPADHTSDSGHAPVGRAPGVRTRPDGTPGEHATEKPSGNRPATAPAAAGTDAARTDAVRTDALRTDAAGPSAAEAGDDPRDPFAGPPPPSERRRRARTMARRRRWLLWTVLLHLASLVTAAVGVAPWWSVVPSVVLLAGYLAVLRVAVLVDGEQRAEAARARAEHDRRERERRRAEELAAQQAEAEIIEFRKHAQLFDQHADRPRRAVGD
ncbi:hypothetical protein [Sphaerisporangium sp. TRM90804]|uniref:divisome protein SepX/GlpR n=1 Tax=Sphaerisporangium sp. TRM90804 TaxID=3031113 RepID=UPI002449D171|nr:hypothetical protein [Sphaerisporangium sp. TRM90804]MDH2430484.1 hypothetical protein [Sphaerisporangium sp. TRM90804]